MAITPSGTSPASTAAKTTCTLAHSPVVNGAPACASNSTAKRQRQHRLAAGQAPVARQVVVGVALAAEQRHDGEAADHHEQVHEEVVERRRDAAGRPRRHAQRMKPAWLMEE